MRLFIASFFSEAMLDWLMNSGLSLSELFPARALRLTGRENLHLTYQFLGEVSGSKLAQISDGVDNALRGIEPFVYSPGLVGVFPDKFRPRTMWIGLEPVSNFQLLASKMRLALEKVVTFDSKRFLPHVTLARFNENHSALSKVDPGSVLLPQIDLFEEDRTIDSVSLCKSDLTPKGPIYTEISRYELYRCAKL